MAKKKMTAADRVWAAREKENKESGSSGGKASIPAEGTAQVEIVDVIMGKDYFKNKAYLFELKVTSGVNEGRKFDKSLGLECPGGITSKAGKTFSEDIVVGWAFDALEKIGVVNGSDRDEVEALVGSTIEVNFKRGANAPETAWPIIWFNSLVSSPSEEDDDDEVDTPTNDVVDMDNGDEEFDFMSVK